MLEIGTRNLWNTKTSTLLWYSTWCDVVVGWPKLYTRLRRLTPAFVLFVTFMTGYGNNIFQTPCHSIYEPCLPPLKRPSEPCRPNRMSSRSCTLRWFYGNVLLINQFIVNLRKPTKTDLGYTRRRDFCFIFCWPLVLVQSFVNRTNLVHKFP